MDQAEQSKDMSTSENPETDFSDNELTPEQQEMLAQAHRDQQELAERQLRLLQQGVISEGDLVMLRLSVLTDFVVPERLRPLLDMAFRKELVDFLDARESDARQKSLLKDVRVPADPTVLTRER